MEKDTPCSYETKESWSTYVNISQNIFCSRLRGGLGRGAGRRKGKREREGDREIDAHPLRVLLTNLL